MHIWGINYFYEYNSNVHITASNLLTNVMHDDLLQPGEISSKSTVDICLLTYKR
jgi:hypothetical protein